MQPETSELPAGLVTFVFTDIEGSTRLFRRLGDRYPPLLERHNEILRSAWRTFGGHEVKTEGDAFFVAFDDATTAVEACAAAQRSLAEQRWPPDAVVRVRMGVHTGLAAPRGHDYVAFAVHLAARVVSTGHGGQVIVSADAAERVRLRGQLRLEPLGLYRVRDFDEPVALFQVEAPGLARDFPPLRVLPADRHNLVATATTLVGRDDDLLTLGSLLTSHRLVSVVGPGGLGKTRLVTEFGLRHAHEWEHGIWFVDLAPISDPELVVDVVAGALSGTAAAVGDPLESLVDHLRDRRTLLLVDNCEHVLEVVARVVDRKRVE